MSPRITDKSSVGEQADFVIVSGSGVSGLGVGGLVFELMQAVQINQELVTLARGS